MENKKFTRVTLETQMTAKCHEHETLMSFRDDDGNYAFVEWWEEEGSKLFYQWIKKHPDHKHMCKWQK